jgi:protein involved in polysaccharide export with SLBB domain
MKSPHKLTDWFGPGLTAGGLGLVLSLIAIGLSPAQTAAAQPDAPKNKGPVFSDVPADFYDPAPPKSPTTNQPPTTTNAMAALDDKHVLAIGDRLSFRIVEDEEDPRPLVVADSGELEVPYLGRFAAAGKSCRQLAYALKAELEKEYYYQATVIIAVDLMARSRGKVYLVGPVRMPGPQEIPSDEVLTISKAILRAGGFTDFADKKNVKITRPSESPGGGDETFTVNVAAILEQGRTEGDIPLRPGDLIYIQERMIRF